jgi:hypothetical protein
MLLQATPLHIETRSRKRAAVQGCRALATGGEAVLTPPPVCFVQRIPNEGMQGRMKMTSPPATEGGPHAQVELQAARRHKRVALQPDQRALRAAPDVPQRRLM